MFKKGQKPPKKGEKVAKEQEEKVVSGVSNFRNPDGFKTNRESMYG